MLHVEAQVVLAKVGRRGGVDVGVVPAELWSGRRDVSVQGWVWVYVCLYVCRCVGVCVCVCWCGLVCVGVCVCVSFSYTPLTVPTLLRVCSSVRAASQKDKRTSRSAPASRQKPYVQKSRQRMSN